MAEKGKEMVSWWQRKAGNSIMQNAWIRYPEFLSVLLPKTQKCLKEGRKLSMEKQ